MLTFPFALREEIRCHAAETYPDECCGILLGEKVSEDDAAVRLIVPAANIADAAARRHRYDVDPRAILSADKIARERHLEILGFYHSHPDHPAAPSKTDMDLAWPDYFYAICSITAAGGHELRAWRLPAAHQPLTEVALA